MEATRASSTSEAPKTHTTHSGDAHQPRSHRHALLRGEARCNAPIAEDPREALVAAEGPPSAKAVEAVEAAAAGRGVHGPAHTDLSRPPRQLAARAVSEAYRWQLIGKNHNC